MPVLAVVLVWVVWPAWLEFAAYSAPAWVSWLGAALASFGMFLGFWANRVLGANFSRTLRVREGHTLVTAGPYSLVRHPIYSSGLLFLFGLSLVMANWLLLAALAPVLFVVNARMEREDRMLEEAFGPAWRKWAGRTGRVFPPLFRGQGETGE